MNILGNLKEGSGLSGVLNVAGSIWQTAQQRKEAALQRDWNEAMMDKQNDFSLDMWNRTNEYNTPANQLARLEDAGLNPLFYSLDGTGNASAFQSAGVQGYNSPNIQNPFASYDPLTMAQVENIRADTRNKNSNSDYTDSLRATEEALRQGKITIQGVEIDLSQSNVRLNNKQRDLLSQQIEESKARCNQIENDINIDWQKLDNETKLQRLEHAKLEFNKWLESQKLSQRDREIAIATFDSQTRRLVAESGIELNEANKYLIQAKTSTEGAIKIQVEAQTQLIGTQTYYNSLYNDNYEEFGNDMMKSQMRALRVNNVVNSVNAACNVVDTAMEAYSTVITGGMAKSIKPITRSVTTNYNN